MSVARANCSKQSCPNFNLDGLSESEINYSKCVLAIITEPRVISVLSISYHKRKLFRSTSSSDPSLRWSFEISNLNPRERKRVGAVGTRGDEAPEIETGTRTRHLLDRAGKAVRKPDGRVSAELKGTSGPYTCGPGRPCATRCQDGRERF